MRGRRLLVAAAVPAIALTTINVVKPPIIEDDRSLPLKYNPHLISQFWKQHPYHVLHRLVHISSTILPFLTRFVFDLKIRGCMDEDKQMRYAVELRELLTQLGPTYIKLGQALSIRPDIIPVNALFELQKLCDKVPCYPNEEAFAMIEAELGKPISEMFDGLELNKDPVAGASLGQVYKCRLKGTDRTVAVKVQRPDIVQHVSLDLLIIRNLYASYDNFFTQLFTNQKAFHLDLIDTFAEASYKEMDYVNEGNNQDRFRKELACFEQIKIPDVVWSHTSRRVLTTEWIEGEKLATASKDTIRKLVPVGVECFLYQLLSTSFFHSDPHPGNLLVQDGKLVLIDFGLCADIPLDASASLTSVLLNLMCTNLDGLLLDVVDLGFLEKEDLEIAELKQVLGQILNSGIIEAGSDTKHRKKHLAQISDELNDIFFNFPFSVPEYFALITRALMTLEGIALSGDDSFDIFEASYPFAVNHAINLFGYTTVASLLGSALTSGGAKNLQKDIIERFRVAVNADQIPTY